MPNKIYDDYWNFTLAYSDFNDDKFIGILRAVVSFIDRTANEPDSAERYTQLQVELQSTLKINDVSIRKGINELIKLGFVNTGLRSYSPDAIPYINARTNEQRSLLLSRIVYSNASFARSATVDSNKREISFIIKTLEANGRLTKRQLAALMRMEVDDKNLTFATAEDLEYALADPSLTEFENRKYNQISHLWTLLRKLDGITPGKEVISLSISDSDQIVDDASEATEGNKNHDERDKYLQKIYKNHLKHEVQEISGKLLCMVDGLDYPPQMYVASHIKPFRNCTYQEAYDPNNGLLLGLVIDKFFDAGLISFDDDGCILLSKRLNQFSKNLNDYLSSKSLDARYINAQRKAYLAYHREKVFN